MVEVTSDSNKKIQGCLSNILWLRQNLLKGVCTDEDLDEAIEMFVSVVRAVRRYPIENTVITLEDLTPMFLHSVKDRLKERVNVTVVDGPAIFDKTREHKDWVEECWSNTSTPYWNRYKEYLKSKKGWTDRVISGIDAKTDEILNACGDPRNLEKDWAYRGLVIGDVQSGKTATYTGLINKAADAGYRLIVVFAGVLENLRSQTQGRLDAEFVGYSSHHDKDEGNFVSQRQEIGVSLCNAGEDKAPLATPITLTSVNEDLQEKMSRNFGLNVSETSAPVLLVLKKNTNVLKNLIAWNKRFNCTEDCPADFPVLVIDDESDNASINTHARPGEATAINREIRQFLKQFRHSTYVGFTATPYANVLMNTTESEKIKVGKEEEEMSDLFPHDFISFTATPTNYFGVEKMLGLADDVSEDDASAKHVRLITDAEDTCSPDSVRQYLPAKHKKTFEPLMPPSMQTAVRQFFLINAIRDLRGGMGSHRSMLINVTYFSDVQMRLLQEVENFSTKLKQEIRLYSKHPDWAKNPEMAELKAIFDEEFASCCETIAWDDVRKQLDHSCRNIQERVVNSLPGSKPLDYHNYKTEGLRVIVIGGYSLSRGLTLEGLCVSYLYRTTATYDTLMQMGRWFGYREGYGDLCRIWLSYTTLNYYRQIYLATEELKDRLREMNESNRKPIEFGLGVRTSPDSLLITSRNKLGCSEEVTIPTNFDKYFIETRRLEREESQNNLETVQELYDAIVEGGCTFAKTNEKETSYRRLYRNVDKSIVADFLDDFQVHPSQFLLRQFDDAEYGLANFIRNNDYEKLKEWDVLFYGTENSADAIENIELDEDFSMGFNARSVNESVFKKGEIQFEKGRIAGSSWEKYPLTEDERKAVKEKGGENVAGRLYCRQLRQRPLLIVSPVLPMIKENDQPKYLMNKPVMTYTLSFCEFAPVASEARSMVNYRVNEIWLRTGGAEINSLGEEEE